MIVLEEGVDLAMRVRDLTDRADADVVLDHIGGAGLASARSTRRGRAVRCRGQRGTPRRRDREIDLFRLARQRILLQSVSNVLTPPEVIGDLFAGISEDLLGDAAARPVRPIVDRTFALDDVAGAYERHGGGSAERKVALDLA